MHLKHTLRIVIVTVLVSSAHTFIRRALFSLFLSSRSLLKTRLASLYIITRSIWKTQSFSSSYEKWLDAFLSYIKMRKKWIRSLCTAPEVVVSASTKKYRGGLSNFLEPLKRTCRIYLARTSMCWAKAEKWRFLHSHKRFAFYSCPIQVYCVEHCFVCL